MSEFDHFKNALYQRYLRWTEPHRAPDEVDWESIEQIFGIRFPPDYKAFHNVLAELSIPGGWLEIIPSTREDTAINIIQKESEIGRIFPSFLVPIYDVGNGDYFCFSIPEGANSKVYCLDHESESVIVTHESFLEFLADIVNSP